MLDGDPLDADACAASVGMHKLDDDMEAKLDWTAI